MKKRIFGLLLAFALLAGMLPFAPLAARAVEGTRVDEISVEVIAPTDGKTTADAPAAAVPGEAGYTFTGGYWVDAELNALKSPVTFREGNTYYAALTLDTKPGYYCAQGPYAPNVTVTGGTLVFDPLISNFSDSSGGPHSQITLYVSVAALPWAPEEIAGVVLNVTPPAAGTRSTNAKADITFTAEGIGEYYAEWKTFVGYAMGEPETMAFVEGQSYYCVITLMAAPGYAFKKGEGHALDVDACDFRFGGAVTVNGGEIYKEKANVRSAADPEYLKIWITVTAGPAQEPAVSVKRGDVDLNGTVDTADARLCLRQAIGLEHYEPGSAQYFACDAMPDGKIETGDARRILRAAIGLENPETWG